MPKLFFSGTVWTGRVFIMNLASQTIVILMILSVTFMINSSKQIYDIFLKKRKLSWDKVIVKGLFLTVGFVGLFFTLINIFDHKTYCGEVKR